MIPYPQCLYIRCFTYIKVYKVIRVYLDDSSSIVDIASSMIEKKIGLIGGARIAGDMRRSTESNYQAGYTVRIEDYEGRIKAVCGEYPEILVLADTEDECMRLVIDEIEKKRKIGTAITRVDNSST